MDKEGLTLEQIKEIYVGKINDTYTLNLAVAMLENYDELLNKLEEKDKEIERLKAREEECMNAYLRARQDVSEYEAKYVVAKYVIDKLEKYFEEEQIRLARENSNIYEDSLGKTRLVNDDIFNEITRIKDKLKELKEGKE